MKIFSKSEAEYLIPLLKKETTKRAKTIKPMKTNKELEKKIEEILSDIDFAEWGEDDTETTNKLLSLFHSYALGIIGEDDYVAMGIDAKESEYKERYYRNQLRVEQRKRI